MNIDLISALLPKNYHIFREEVSYTKYLTAHCDQQQLFEEPPCCGFCPNCNSSVKFNHLSQVSFAKDDQVYLNLREGFICSRCKLNNRQRLLYFTVKAFLKVKQISQPYISERLTHLYYKLLEILPNISGSEYLGSDKVSGQEYQVLITNSEVIFVEQQDITKLSYADISKDLVLSGDVLEHIPNYEAALKEMHRVLVKEGILLFSVPFSDTRKSSFVRARLLADGRVEHLMPPEVHGNPIDPNGSLAYHSFGWDILDKMRNTGFRDVAAIYLWNLNWGFVHTNSPDLAHFMGPLLFMAVK